MLIVEGVGIFDALWVRQTADTVTAAIANPAALPFASPWGDGELARIAFEDFLHHEPPMGSREQAMRLAPIARARNLLVSTIARLPLRAYAGATVRPDADCPFLIRTGTSTSWQHRNAWTTDDLIFYGASLWSRVNGAGGFPLTADRVDRGRWLINPDNRVEVDGVEQKDSDVILITGFHEGILSFGMDVLNDARELQRVVRDRIENPIPAIDLHQTGGTALTKEERNDLVSHWRAARKAKGGAAVAYSSESIEVNELGAGGDANLLVEARNASALDQARIVGVTGSRIDATTAKASLNYETTTGRNQELVDFDLALYLTPVAARLSLDDVVPVGTRVAQDLTELTDKVGSVSGPTVED